MALYDDVNFLLMHVRNSFITSDDTGLCEQVLDAEEVSNRIFEKLKTGRPIESDDSDGNMSPDIEPDVDFGVSRRRSNTQMRLDKMRKDKQKKTQIKHIPWKILDRPFSEEDLDDLFQPCPVPAAAATPSEDLSPLSRQLKEAAGLPVNPFNSFASFDGRSAIGVQTKKLEIVLTMADGELMSVVVVINLPETPASKSSRPTTVQDLIGLICWQYTIERKEPLLLGSKTCYSLYMVDECGDVEEDFPPLALKEPISKFGFRRLALVQTGSEKGGATADKPDNTAAVVTVHISGKGFSKFQLDSLSCALQEVYDKAIVKRRSQLHPAIRPGMDYYLEKYSEPGKELSLEDSVESTDTTEFCLVRRYANRAAELREVSEEREERDVLDDLCLQYKSFDVYILHKLLNYSARDHVHLGIAGDKIEVNPASSKNKFLKHRPATYDTEQLVECRMLEEKPSGKSTFRLVHLSSRGPSETKQLTIETDAASAREIVQKISAMIELKGAPGRRELVDMRQKKPRRISLPVRTSSYFAGGH